MPRPRRTLVARLPAAAMTSSASVPPRRPRARRGADRAGRRHRFGVPGESFLAVLDGFYEHRERIRFIACRQEGGAAYMAEAQGKLTRPAGHLLRHARAGREQRRRSALHTAFQDSTPMILFIGQVASDQRDREAFQEVDYRADVRPRHARLRQVGRRGARRRPAAGVRGARLPHRAAGPARAGGAGAARGHAGDADRGAGAAARRAGARLAGARRRCASVRALLLAAERPFVIAGGSGWDARRVRGAAALRRALAAAGRLRLPLPGRASTTAIRNYAGDVGIGINPKLAARMREADLISPSARGSAR